MRGAAQCSKKKHLCTCHTKLYFSFLPPRKQVQIQHLNWRKGWDDSGFTFALRAATSGVQISILICRTTIADSHPPNSYHQTFRQYIQHFLYHNWRKGWDSNPRRVAPCRFSRPVPSTARPPFHHLRPIIRCFATKVAQDITQLPDDNDDITPSSYSTVKTIVFTYKLFDSSVPYICYRSSLLALNRFITA